jgi:hypothetical protein
MNRDKVYVGDARVRITLETGIDISSAPELAIAFQRPDGTSGVWTAQLDGTEDMYVVTEPDTLDQAGAWRLQARRRWSDTEKQDGAAVALMVYEAFH